MAVWTLAIIGYIGYLAEDRFQPWVSMVPGVECWCTLQAFLLNLCTVHLSLECVLTISCRRMGKCLVPADNASSEWLPGHGNHCQHCAAGMHQGNMAWRCGIARARKGNGHFVIFQCISMCFTSFLKRNHPIAPIAEVDSGARLSSGSWLWSWDRLRWATPSATPSAAVWCPMLAEWLGRCRCSEKCWVNWRRPGVGWVGWRVYIGLIGWWWLQPILTVDPLKAFALGRLRLSVPLIFHWKHRSLKGRSASQPLPRWWPSQVLWHWSREVNEPMKTKITK